MSRLPDGPIGRMGFTAGVAHCAAGGRCPTIAVFNYKTYGAAFIEGWEHECYNHVVGEATPCHIASREHNEAVRAFVASRPAEMVDGEEPEA